VTRVDDPAVGPGDAVVVAEAHDAAAAEGQHLGGVGEDDAPAAGLSGSGDVTGTGDGDEGFYGFDTKYLDDIVTAQMPAPLDDATTELISSLAIEAFHALDGEGLARVDFFVTDNGPVVNEVNTMPGFTPFSMYPYMWKTSGLDHPDLVGELIELALERPADVNR